MTDPTSPAALPDTLVDRFGRQITYVRISVTDRCDLRCVYCMAEDMTFLPRSEVLSLEELLFIMQGFTEMGVRKIRITGGEPLVRRNVLWLLNEAGKLPGLDELVMTTNGTQLEKLAPPLRDAGVSRLNISLDTLKADQFRELTRYGNLERVLNGIEAARRAGFERIKLNSVILKNRNHDQILDLVDYAIARGIDISFIEEMPLGLIGDHDRAEAYYSSDAVHDDIRAKYELVPTTENTGGPSRYYRIPDTATRVGFISPHSHNFCDTCNRVRLTTEGRLLLCLGQEHSMDLRAVVREHPGDMDRLKRALVDSMAIKPSGHEFNLEEKPVIFRHMSVTGG